MQSVPENRSTCYPTALGPVPQAPPLGIIAPTSRKPRVAALRYLTSVHHVPQLATFPHCLLS